MHPCAPPAPPPPALASNAQVIKNIERGEQKIQRQADIMAALRAKIERYRNPWQDLKVGAQCRRGAAARQRVVWGDSSAARG